MQIQRGFGKSQATSFFPQKHKPLQGKFCCQHLSDMVLSISRLDMFHFLNFFEFLLEEELALMNKKT